MSMREKLLSNVMSIECEVEVRKYPVDKDRLKQVLKSHKNMSNEQISKILNKPKTLVEHWFRNDNCFAIPDADIWLKLKDLLNIDTDEFDESIMTFETKGGNYDLRNRVYFGDISPTLMTGSEKDLYMVKDSDSCHSLTYRKSTHPRNKDEGQGWEETKINDTLNVFDNGESRTPTLILENHPNDSRVKINQDNVFQTLSGRMGTGGGNVPMMLEKGENMSEHYIVRRLTPMECERLQGYPDGWTDIGDWVDSKGKKHKGDADAPRYKALGNSIALPYWDWLAERITSQYDRPTTMGSLFDGIGGFPLCFSRHNCEPVWASEIEEFPIAVTKLRFPEKVGE